MRYIVFIYTALDTFIKSSFTSFWMKDSQFKDLIIQLKDASLSKEQVQKIKNQWAKKHSLARAPTDIEIGLHAAQEELKELKHLQTKPVRSISGVAPVAVMTSPARCPHGKCLMCPGGPDSEFGDVPQSYTGKEPATMRAIRAGFDAYLQVFNRLEQYIVTGHVPDKVELIIMGGTFPSRKKEYQEQFVKECFQAMNDFSALFFRNKKDEEKVEKEDKKRKEENKKRKEENKARKDSKEDEKEDKWSEDIDIERFKEFFELPGPVGDKTRTEHIQKKLADLKKRSEKNLEEEQTANETAKIRCVGLTIETKPDWAMLEEGNEMLRLGCTRVELGVQSVYESALKATHRGHTIADNIRATQILKDLGFKINYHYMLGLPTVSRKKELPGLLKLFNDPDWQPDMLKIYPCMVMRGTGLYDIWKKGDFTPITTEEAAEIMAEFKKDVPSYVRIMRVQRDIPTYRTEAGVDRTNLRQYIHEICKKKGIVCQCIRCREIGRHEQEDVNDAELKVIEYEASGGKEYFISYETEKALFGFVRLRFPGETLRQEITSKSALIRELHVYGTAVGLGDNDILMDGTPAETREKIQHKGIGKLLLEKAEKLAAENGKQKMVVISGIGVREYYKKLGYSKEGAYMVKRL